MNFPSDYIQGMIIFGLAVTTVMLLIANLLKEEEDKEIYSEEVIEWIREGL